MDRASYQGSFADHRPPASDHRPPASDRRPPAADRRPPAADRRPASGGRTSYDDRRSGPPARRSGPAGADDRDGPGYLRREPERGSRRREEDIGEKWPDLPEWATAEELDLEVRRDLRGLSKEGADWVAAHLVAASTLADEEPETAWRHARAARARGGRIGVVRETVGLVAYRAGEWAEAIGELRAARRMGGGPGHLAVLADCERALGHPEKAIELSRSAEADELDPEASIELSIVVAGARADLDQVDVALANLERLGLDKAETHPRLAYAYADLLLKAGRQQEALSWFIRSANADAEEETDALDRVADLSDEELSEEELSEEELSEEELSEEELSDEELSDEELSEEELSDEERADDDTSTARGGTDDPLDDESLELSTAFEADWSPTGNDSGETSDRTVAAPPELDASFDDSVPPAELVGDHPDQPAKEASGAAANVGPDQLELDQHSAQQDGVEQDGVDQEGVDQEGVDQEGVDRRGVDPSSAYSSSDYPSNDDPNTTAGLNSAASDPQGADGIDGDSADEDVQDDAMEAPVTAAPPLLFSDDIQRGDR
jgi:uncharacterized protein YjbI with pentapeptide repeats